MITGAGGGFGAALAPCLYNAGANLVLQNARIEPLQAQAQSEGWARNRILLQAHHVTDRVAVASAAATAIERFKNIDVLINLAGINRFGGILTTREDDWDEIMDVNVTGYYLSARAVIATMLKSGSGCILNMSSVWGQRGNPTMMAYAASKHAVEGLTASLRAEVASHGIKVSSLIVGIADTAFREAMKEHVSFTEQQCALMLQPSDIVAAVNYMLSTSPNALVSSLTLEAWRLQQTI
jgi:NADP-dependent 3-hydroxy acid dehydrogenase YdfG